MKKRLFISILFLSLSVAAFSQVVRDGSYRSVGRIESDGTVRDASYRKIGSFDSDGTVRDDSYRKIGVVEKDGTVRDASYRKIGTVEGTDRNRAAVFFFFNRFG